MAEGYKEIPITALNVLSIRFCRSGQEILTPNLEFDKNLEEKSVLLFSMGVYSPNMGCFAQIEVDRNQLILNRPLNRPF
jgi:hypothetical protein